VPQVSLKPIHLSCCSCRRASALTPGQQATLATTLCDTLRGGGKGLHIDQCKRLLQQLLRLPLLPAAQLLSLLSEPDAAGTEGLPQAAQELVVEALAGMDDQQQVSSWARGAVMMHASRLWCVSTAGGCHCHAVRSSSCGWIVQNHSVAGSCYTAATVPDCLQG
jgi:hypothetical protein